MSYKQYTHELLIKNPHEIIKNRVPQADLHGKISYFSEPNRQDNQATRNKIIIPGLINLHTHLAYTHLKLAEQKLFSWLKELVKNIYKIPQMEDENQSKINEFELLESYLAGSRECLKTGTTFVVENTSHPEIALEAFKHTGLQGIIGVEVFGSDPLMAQEIFKKTINKIKELENPVYEMVLSPHASYDTSAELWGLCLEYSRNNHQLLLSHLSESAEEEAWFKNKDSAEARLAREFWSDINTLDAKIKNWKPYRSATEFLSVNKLLADNLLLAHCCYVDDEDLKLLQDAQSRLVTCPRSNAYLKNQKAKTALWQKYNLAFGVGTDSKASNYSLDLREEVNQLSEHDAQKRFSLITLTAAQILNKENEIGSLEIGKKADWVVLEITDPHINLDLCDPFKLVMDPKISHVKEVYISGTIHNP
jgi:cytosine/adenosine deaminase-related metal-dependent hydrolase